MKTKKVNYKIINIIFIILAFLFFINSILHSNLVVDYFKNIDIVLFSITIILFVCIHILKILRLYVILLEEKISIKRFIRIYIKTTFVNIALPLKMGELFRFYSYSEETKNYKIGFFAIIVERFLDTCALLLFIMPIQAFYLKKISIISILLIMFIVCGFVSYNIFDPIYRYINKFLILNSKSRKSLKILKFLEESNCCYVDCKRLIQGRFLLVFCLSFFAWSLEYIFVYGAAKMLKKKCSLEIFNTYINSAFNGQFNIIYTFYTLMGLISFGIILFVIYIKRIKRGGKS